MPDRTLILIGGGAVLVLVALGYVAAKKAGALAPGALDPTSRDNLAYRGANEIGAALTGNKDWSVGVAVWELLNPAQAAKDNQVAAPVATKEAPAVFDPARDVTPFWYGAP